MRLNVRNFRVLALLAFLFLLNGSQAADQPAFHPNRIIIIPKADRAADTATLHKQKGRRVRRRFPAMKNLEVVELPAGQDVLATIQEYQASGLVESAEPDYVLHKSVVPDDPSFLNGLQWHLNSSTVGGVSDPDINAPEGWEIRHDATNIIVAIIDSGLRMTHQDLAPNLWTNTKEVEGNGLDDDADGYIDDVHGINSITGSGDPTDDDGHGTHVAGIIGAAGNNGLGITGVAWKVQLMPLKFIDSTGTGFTSDGVECVNYAIKHGAQVINASFGGAAFSASLQTAISSARTAGIVFVAAAGNESSNNDVTPSYPANYSLDNVISVCATTSMNALDTSYSNYGLTTVDIGAPGTLIYSCGNSSDTAYVYMSGTSMATPVVTGVVALMKAQFPADTPAQTRLRLLATADPLPSLAGKCVSGGKVNLERALTPYVTAAFTPSALAGSFPLTVRFTNQSVGEITGYAWDFDDGSPIATDQNPTHVFASEGSYNVKLTVTGEGVAASSVTRQISVEPSYTFKSVAYEWIDPTAMTRFFLADNGVSGAQDLPFAFYFYGQPKTKIYIAANGILAFDSTSLATTSNSDIPTAASPNGVILPYWDNLNPASSGAIYAGVVGEAPNRRYVVSWVGVTRNSSSDKMTFQAVLNETTGQIQYNYQEVNPTSARGGGARATVGVEDPSGLAATKYCFDGLPNHVANGQSILFVASGTGGLEVTPDALSSFVGFASDLQTNVVSFTLKNTSRRPLLWRAAKTQPWVTLSATSGSLDSDAETTVTATINSGIATLAPGSYTNTISFQNLNNSVGDAQRDITLEVNAKLEATFKEPTFDNGVLRFEVSGLPGQSYVIEASTDLTIWLEIQPGVIDASGIIPFTDPAASDGNRFFRVKLVP